MKDLTPYAEAVLNRFKNPYIKHYLQSISLNAVSKFKTRNLPTLHVYIKQTGRLPERLVFALSALIYSYWNGRYEPEDDADVLAFFQMVWPAKQEDMFQATAAVLGEERLWGMNLNEHPELTERTAFFLRIIHEQGMKYALKECFVKRGEAK